MDRNVARSLSGTEKDHRPSNNIQVEGREEGECSARWRRVRIMKLGDVGLGAFSFVAWKRTWLSVIKMSSSRVEGGFSANKELGLADEVKVCSHTKWRRRNFQTAPYP